MLVFGARIVAVQTEDRPSGMRCMMRSRLPYTSEGIAAHNGSVTGQRKTVRRNKPWLRLFLIVVAFVAFGGAASYFPVASFTKIMGDAVIIEAGQDFGVGWMVGAMAEDTVVFLEPL